MSETNLTSKQIRELSRTSSETLFGIQRDENSNNPDGYSPVQPEQRATLITPHCQVSVALRNGLKVIRAQSQCELPFLYRREAAQVACVKGVGALLKAERALLDAGLIRVHTLAQQRTNKCLWEILAPGYEALGLSEPKWQSKGGYLHKFCAHRIANTYICQGYEAEIEYFHSNGKLVDLRVSNTSNEIFVEICASTPLEKELSNIELDLRVAPYPNELLLAVTKRAMRDSLITLIAERLGNHRLPSQVRVVLAGDLIDSLKLPQ